MDISIIIPNYNGKRFIESCLESILRQDSSLKYEVIFIDNNSSDGSLDYVKNNYGFVKAISLDKNMGFSKAVNEGIKCSKGEYVILLNNDTELEQNWLNELVKCIEKDQKIFSVCSKMVQYENRNIIDDAGDNYTLLGWTQKRGDYKVISNYCKNAEVFSSCAGAAIYRRDVFNQIGYFDENFFAYMEDVDISYRAKIFGYKNMYCSNAVVYHIGSATSGSRYNSFKIKLAARNNVYVVYKNMPILQLMINLPFLFMGFFIKSLFFYKKGFGREYAAGLKEGLCNLNKIKKVNYQNNHILNYIKIEIEMIINIFKYVFAKLIR